MQKKLVAKNYVYSTNMMFKNIEYDIDDMCVITDDTETAVCNNDCMNCMLECPYREF